MSTAQGGYGLLKEMMSTCACGLVINLHGSSGNWNVVTHAAMLAAMGYVVVMPDSQSMPDSYGLKGNMPLLPIEMSPRRIGVVNLNRTKEIAVSLQSPIVIRPRLTISCMIR